MFRLVLRRFSSTAQFVDISNHYLLPQRVFHQSCFYSCMSEPPQKTAKMSEPVLQVKKLSDNATIPTRGSAFAAGYDLYAAEDKTLDARGKGIVKTDLAIALPPGCYGRVAPRSGLAAKHHIDVGAGVIDADYRGNVGVVLFNFADQAFEVRKGDRIAQLVLERIFTPEISEVSELPDTDRGAGGFGSTGKQ